jgi:hypothetical protein
MSINYKKIAKDINEFPNTHKGKKYFEKERQKHKIKMGRYLKFEKYLETHDFDQLMHRLILQHGEEWEEKCWRNGFEVHPNNVLGFVIDYVFHNIKPISVPQIESDFPNATYFFKGYYFQITYGQGSIINIYDGKNLKLLLSV